MSIRVYHGPHADRHSGPPHWFTHVPTALAAITIGLQIMWPLAHDTTRATISVLVVWAFFLSSFTHAWLHRGFVWTLVWALLSLGFGFGIEVLGTRTGIPFGRYRYSPNALGWSISDIPIIIPMAWAMMSYPALLVGRRLGSSALAVTLVAAWALASWDLFLDPQMVGEGYWTWESPSPELPGIPGIPFVNFLGWLVASAVLMAILHRVLPDPHRSSSGGSAPMYHHPIPEGVPATLYLWTWVGGIVANVFFLHRPTVGIIGGIAMGLVAVPYAFRLTERPQ